MSLGVLLHQGTTEGPAEWLLGRVCKFQAWLLSISEAVLFFAAALGAHSNSAEVLWNTTHQMRCDWYRHIALFILGRTNVEGKDAKSAHLLLDEVWWLSGPMEVAV